MSRKREKQMEPHTFDDFTRRIAANSLSRRQALQTIIAGIVGGVFGLRVSEESQAMTALPAAGCCTANDTLWIRINNRVQECAKNSNHCFRINPKQGYALSPEDPHTIANLLVPTTCISGIECPATWLNNSPNYWYLAWTNLGMGLGSRAGMAINSQVTRTQNQLHIHVTCVDSAVSSALDALDSKIKSAPNWSLQTVKGRQFRTFRLDSDGQLASYNLFAFVHSIVGTGNMGKQAIAVVKRKKGGFYVLNSDSGYGEALLGHC